MNAHESSTLHNYLLFMAFDWGNVKTANLADATRRYPVDNAADFDKPHVRVESLE